MTTDGTDSPSSGDPASSPGNNELAATLRQVEEVRHRTRTDVHPAWFPMLVFGVLGLVSVPFGFVGHGVGSGLFWLVAGPAGGVATSRYYRNRARSIGAGVRGRAHTVVGVALFLGAWVGGAITGSAAVPMLAIAIGYLAFARLEHSPPIAVVAAGLGVAAVAVAATDPAHGDVLLTLAFGMAFASTGLVLRSRDRG